MIQPWARLQLGRLVVATAATLAISALSLPVAFAGSDRARAAAAGHSTTQPLVETLDGAGPAPKALYEPSDFVASAVYGVTNAHWLVWNHVHAIARATLETTFVGAPATFQTTTITYSAPAMRCGVYGYTLFKTAAGGSATLASDCRFAGPNPKAPATDYLPRLLVGSFDNGTLSPEILYKPRNFAFSHYTVTNARWLQWSATQAVAQATLETGFAGAPVTFKRTTIVFSIPAARCGVYTYTVFSSASGGKLAKLYDEAGFGCLFAIV
jgi:hypothetical protein